MKLLKQAALLAGSALLAMNVSAAPILIQNAAGEDYTKGNDIEGGPISTDYGFDVSFVSKIDLPTDKNGSFFITLNDDQNEGTWEYKGTENIDIIAVKAGNNYALYDVSMEGNSSTWSTAILPANGSKAKELSHLTAYTCVTANCGGSVVGSDTVGVPTPASLPLLASALGLLVALRRKQA